MHQVQPGGAARLTGPPRAQVNLVVLLSAVENAISGGAFRPGDAYSSARRTSELSDDAVIPAAVLEGAPQACARGSNAPSLLGKIRK